MFFCIEFSRKFCTEFPTFFASKSYSKFHVFSHFAKSRTETGGPNSRRPDLSYGIDYEKKLNLKELIDVGAHKGEFLSYATKISSIKKFYAFEPQKPIFKILKKIIIIPKLKKGTILPFHKAPSGT